MVVEALVITMSLTQAEQNISKIPPQNRLFTGRLFVSIFTQIGLMALFQAIMYQFTIRQGLFLILSSYEKL